MSCAVSQKKLDMKKKILTIVGTRPNFIKITQFKKSFSRYSEHLEYKLLHTGQHFDENMSKIFFDQLKINEPDFYLNIENKGSKMNVFLQLETALFNTFKEYEPDLVIVVGDVNSTYAAAHAAYLAGIKVAHVESGLRSYDRGMPEEINRLLTDEISDILFVTEESGLVNLGKEGKNYKQIFFVGNTMIDSLVSFDGAIDESGIIEEVGVKKGEYILCTMHRPSNVDTKEGLLNVLEMFSAMAERYKVVLPIHPRTKKNFEKFGLKSELESIDHLLILPPIGYLDFQKLVLNAKLIVTDSGGIQEEATFRQVPCVTLRNNTERPITVKIGTNELIEINATALRSVLDLVDSGDYKKSSTIPPLWDGKSTDRIVDHIYDLSIKGVI